MLLNNSIISVFIWCTILINTHHQVVYGHGMMLEPPNRSSLWRFDSSAPINYNDNQNFCGGKEVQWGGFGGKCGVCGDPYDEPHPQSNENTGVYGRGTIVRHYHAGQIINVSIVLTANHLGHFRYSVCKLDEAEDQPERGEDCFRALQLEDAAATQYNVSKADFAVENRVQLPDDLVCERCVLRWDYTAGNNWGECPDGTYGDGCGPQETFRSCSDISIGL